VSRQATSGQTVRAWCREHEVTEAAFYWWRRELARRDAKSLPVVKPDQSRRRDVERPRLARRDSERSQSPRQSNRSVNRQGPERLRSARCDKTPPAASFVPVQVIDTPGPVNAPHLEIVLADGRCVRVTGPVNPQALTDVLDVLEGRAC